MTDLVCHIVLTYLLLIRNYFKTLFTRFTSNIPFEKNIKYSNNCRLFYKRVELQKTIDIELIVCTVHITLLLIGEFILNENAIFIAFSKIPEHICEKV